MMQNVFRWHLKQTFESMDNLLCPSPYVVDNQLLIFFGQQDKLVRAARLKCIRVSSDLEGSNFNISFEKDDEHQASLGNLPNSVFLSEACRINLICAEFTGSTSHKHRLLTHLHHITIGENGCFIQERSDLTFVDYDSDEFHTVAGMSFFGDNYLYAKGSTWHENQKGKTPVTHIYEFDTKSGSEYEIEIPFEKEVVAYARPNKIRVGQQDFLALSVRLRNGAYGSRLYLDSENGYTKVVQTFQRNTHFFAEDELAYGYPFFWMDNLWCLATLDFRGGSGFQLFQLV